ncbi:hypothetical protein GGS21DRAFT_529974 [Xylaria nigripes]|nr:hypothetical protein GGS21DRAFT_529974 [Xylaria nigripes]
MSMDRDPHPPMLSFGAGAQGTHQPPIMAGQKRKFGETEASSDEQSGQYPPSSDSGSQTTDVIDRGIVTMEEASVLFQRYVDHMAAHLPAVVFPSGTTAGEIRNSKPILFLAILSVASSENSNIQQTLVNEFTQILADKVVVRGEKSLELVQSILVSVIWYFPPEHFEELKFYQMVHVAAIMAIDIGLGKKKNSSKSHLVPYTWRDHPLRKHPLPDPSTLESRRTWLAVYFLATNVAMALHRPNLIRWQSFMTECMEILQSSVESAPGDRYLCHLVWTHHLAEEVGVVFSLDDPSIIVNVTDRKIHHTLRLLERDLARYKQSLPQVDKQPSLLFSFDVLNLYMNEIALQSNDESNATSNAEALHRPIIGLGDNLTPAHINALSVCLTAIDGIFETVLSLDVFCIRCLPIFNFVRVAYAVVVLIKIYFSSTYSHLDISMVFDKDKMNVPEYLDRLYKKFVEVADQDKSRPASKFLLVIGMLRNWFQTHNTRSQSELNTHPDMTTSQFPSDSQHGGPHPITSHDQQHHNQPQYKPTNIPPQILSEIMAAKGPAQINQSSHAPPGPNMNMPAYPGYMGPGVPVPYDIYGPNQAPPTSTTAVTDNLPSHSYMPWVRVPFIDDLNYFTMGDGLEQAMGITLTGFGDFSHEVPVSYEHTVRMMAQSDPNFMNPMNEYASTTGNNYGP